MDRELRSLEVDRNYDFFQRHLETFITDHRGQYALLHGAVLIGFYDRPVDALVEGNERYPDGLFSIQEVTDEPIDLGFFSHVSH